MIRSPDCSLELVPVSIIDVPEIHFRFSRLQCCSTTELVNIQRFTSNLNLARSMVWLCHSGDGQLVKAIFYWKISGSVSFGIFTNFPICCSSSQSTCLNVIFPSDSSPELLIFFLFHFPIKQVGCCCSPVGRDLKYLPFSDNVPF